MTERPQSSYSVDDYAFRFDSPIEPVIFGGKIDLSGWLLQLKGKPINGIRAIASRKFLGRRIFRGRRKRSRPDVAASYPELPDARASGFLIELRLPLGRNRLTLQVRDHERIWRTFHSTSVAAFPLVIFKWLGFSNFRRFLIFYLKHLFAPRDFAAQQGSPLPFAPARTQPAFPIRYKNVDLFATSKSNLFILEIGELVAAGFREIGYNARLRLDEQPAARPTDDTLQIVVTPHEYYNLYLREILPRRAIRELTRNLVLFCTEQPETGWFQSNLQWAIHARGVADINALSVAAYRSRGLSCLHFHLGYHPMLSHPVKIPHRDRTCDITFLGSMTPRREKFIADNADFFSRHRSHLRLVPLGFAKTKTTRSYLSVERRNELLANSRILLNLHYSDQKYFEWHRMLVGLANGCCIITETCHGYGALQPGRHFIMVEPEYLVPCCEYYLAHPEECEQIARQGLEFIQIQLRQSQGCQTFLQQIEAENEAQPAGDGGRSFVATRDSPSDPLPPD